MFRSKSENSLESRATGHWPWQALTTEETLTTSCSSACLTQCSAHHPHVHLSGNISQSSYVLALHAPACPAFTNKLQVHLLQQLHSSSPMLCYFAGPDSRTKHILWQPKSTSPPCLYYNRYQRRGPHTNFGTLKHKEKKYSCLVSHSSDIYL